MDAPLATEADLKLLNECGKRKLEELGYFGVLDRIKNTEKMKYIIERNPGNERITGGQYNH